MLSFFSSVGFIVFVIIVIAIAFGLFLYYKKVYLKAHPKDEEEERIDTDSLEGVISEENPVNNAISEIQIRRKRKIEFVPPMEEVEEVEESVFNPSLFDFELEEENDQLVDEDAIEELKNASDVIMDEIEEEVGEVEFETDEPDVATLDVGATTVYNVNGESKYSSSSVRSEGGFSNQTVSELSREGSSLHHSNTYNSHESVSSAYSQDGMVDSHHVESSSFNTRSVHPKSRKNLYNDSYPANATTVVNSAQNTSEYSNLADQCSTTTVISGIDLCAQTISTTGTLSASLNIKEAKLSEELECFPIKQVVREEAFSYNTFTEKFRDLVHCLFSRKTYNERENETFTVVYRSDEIPEISLSSDASMMLPNYKVYLDGVLRSWDALFEIKLQDSSLIELELGITFQLPEGLGIEISLEEGASEKFGVYLADKVIKLSSVFASMPISVVLYTDTYGYLAKYKNVLKCRVCAL